MAPVNRFFTYKPGAAPQGRLSQQLRLQPGQTVGFQTGRGYYAKPAPATAAAASPPASPLSQASTLAEALYQPIIDQINAAAAQRSQAGTQAITGATSELAKKLAATDYGAPYVPAIGDAAAADAALHSALQGAGSADAAALKSKLAALGAPAQTAIDQEAAAVGQNGAGNANAVLGGGTAALDALLATKAANEAYGQKLPGIAGSQGVQDVANLEQTINGDVSSKLGDIAQNEPTFAYKILQDEQQTKAANAKAAAATATARGKVNPTLSASMGYVVNNYGEAITGRDGKPVPYTPYAKPSAAAPRIIKGADGYYSVSAGGKTTSLGIPVPATGGSKAPQIKGSASTGYFVYDPNTKKLKPLPGPYGKPSSGGISSAETKRLQQVYDKAVTQAQKLHSGTKDLLGQPKPVKFADALKQVQAYFLGQGIADKTYARRQSLKALAAAGYPVRADLIPPDSAPKGSAAQDAAYRTGSVAFSGASLAGESPTLLQRVQQAAAAMGASSIDVTSAARPPGPGNDVSDSNHIRKADGYAHAIDGYAIVNGQRVPLSQLILPVASRFGLRSGDVKGFDPKTPGGYDPVHVDDGYNVRRGV